MARRKVKKWREEPLGTMSYQTSSKRLPPFCLLIGARKLLCFSAQSEGRMAATIWNWSGKTLSPGALLAVLYFSSCHISCRLDLPSPPLSAPGFPKMGVKMTEGSFCPLQRLEKDLKKLENFQHSELFSSRAQIVQNKACKMWKIAAKLSKFPLEFLLEACQQLKI